MNHATHDAGAGASAADGPWLDMSAFADLDPDDALGPGDAGLLSSALAVDEGALPDDVFARMLAVTWEQPSPDATPDTADSTDHACLAGPSDDAAADHDAVTTDADPWSAGPDDGGGDPVHDPDLGPDQEHDPAAWGGDVV